LNCNSADRNRNLFAAFAIFVCMWMLGASCTGTTVIEEPCNSDLDCNADELCQNGQCIQFGGIPNPDAGSPVEDGGDNGDGGTLLPPDAGSTVTDGGGQDSGSILADAGTNNDGGAISADGGATIIDAGGQDDYDAGADGGGLGSDAGGSLLDAGPPESECNKNEIDQNGLLAHFSFDEDAGMVAGSGSDGGWGAGDLQGAEWTDGLHCGALSFDGDQQYVDVSPDIPSSMLPAESLTIALWFRATDLQEHKWGRFFSHASGTDISTSHIVLSSAPEGNMAGSTNIISRVRLKTNGDTTAVLSDGPFLQNDVWTHIAATYDGSQLSLYQDGNLAGQAPVTGPITYAEQPFWVGRSPVVEAGIDNSSVSFVGKIDDVAIYERALSESEITTLMGDLAAPVEFSAISCPTAEYGAHTYAFCEQELSHSNARAHCLEAGMDLVSIQDLEENQWLDAQISAGTISRAWIGLSDITQEGVFQWLDGSAAPLRAWISGEPNNAQMAEHCAEIFPGALWNDNVCNLARAFICESQEQPTDVFKLCRDVPGDCPCDTVSGSSGEYLYCPAAPWGSAAAQCRAWGSDLPGIHDEELNTELMGLSDGAEHWLGATGSIGAWSWSDGSVWDFSSWGNTQPNHPGSQNCVLMNQNGLWLTKNCNGARRFLCPVPVLEDCLDTDSDGWGEGCFLEPDCAPDVNAFGGVCPSEVNICDGLLTLEMQVGADGGQSFEEEKTACSCEDASSFGDSEICFEELDWFTARDACRAMGKELAKISSPLLNQFPMDVDAWIGLTTSPYSNKWLDGTLLSSGFDNLVQNAEENGCIYREAETQDWLVDDCSNKRPFLCK
jgi:hypothetical protein